MSRESQLEKALTKLKAMGKKIGAPETWNGEEVIPVDNVMMTQTQIFQMTEISPEG